MNFLFFFILFVSNALSSLSAQEKETVNLIVEVSATKYNKGNILIALYDHEENYMKKSFMSYDVKVQNGKAIIHFTNIKKGEYAFSLFHDINCNKKLDSNFLGIPKEPYAFSNNQKGRFGPPNFKKVKFNIVQDEHLKVTIK